ncbi:MAG: hypothetical protein HND58_09640 [Planctomycetota bacterium]|nr:MAG: hypothetical protein HND58_09640 [Planctomycetota bacterium]
MTLASVVTASEAYRWVSRDGLVERLTARRPVGGHEPLVVVDPLVEGALPDAAGSGRGGDAGLVDQSDDGLLLLGREAVFEELATHRHGPPPRA